MVTRPTPEISLRRGPSKVSARSLNTRIGTVLEDSASVMTGVSAGLTLA